MKPLTRHQRAAIYRQAAERVYRNIQKGYISRCCVHLGDRLQRGFSRTPDAELKAIFSEFYFWQPKRYKNGWWLDDLDGNNCRILALLLSAEMTLKP